MKISHKILCMKIPNPFFLSLCLVFYCNIILRICQNMKELLVYFLFIFIYYHCNKKQLSKEELKMSNSNSSNKAAVPEAKSALNRFKYEVANELGVPLTDGYNGNLTSKQNGSVGGYMVKKMIEAQERQMSSGGSMQQY